MEEDTILNEFVRQVQEQLNKLNAADGKEVEQLQTALSMYVMEKTQELVKQGWPVLKIQELLRAATDMVPQTHAPDDTGSDSDEVSESAVGSITYFLPMEESVITSFAAGKISYEQLKNLLCTLPDLVPIEMAEGLDHVLTDYGKNMALDEATGGGELVAGPDGEAFIPEHIDVRYESENSEIEKSGAVREPLVFKTPAQVMSIKALLDPVTEYVFHKKADIKKLLKAGWLADYDKKAIKKDAPYIIKELWKEFVTLKGVYRKAAEQRKGMAVFIGYERV